MRDIDRILAQHYGSSAPASAPGRVRSGGAGPHFPVPPERSRTRAEDAVGFEAGAGFTWPETVLALEQAHGPRFEALAQTLRRLGQERGHRVLLFTSCHRAEGCTTLTLALARALGHRSGRTLLVDGDLGGPMLARLLGVRPVVGLEDVLASGRSPFEACLDAGDDRLRLLPLRAAMARPREVQAQPSWRTLMARLRHEFDLVLIDGGPLFSGLGSTRLPAGVDAAVLVHHRGISSERSLRRARAALAQAQVPLLGLAETFVG